MVVSLVTTQLTRAEDPGQEDRPDDEVAECEPLVAEEDLAISG
jgi:hypothetical protein